MTPGLNALFWNASPPISLSGVVSAPNTTGTKIQSFANLPHGWHYGSGSPPTDQMIERALNWHGSLLNLGFASTDAFPGIDGEIMITGYLREHYIEITLELDDSVTLVYERNSDIQVHRERIMAIEAHQTLEETARAIWSALGSYIQITSITNRTDSRAWLSVSHPTAAARQFSTNPVSMGRAQQFVNTSGNIMRLSQVNRQFSGSSTVRSSRRDIA